MTRMLPDQMIFTKVDPRNVGSGLDHLQGRSRFGDLPGTQGEGSAGKRVEVSPERARLPSRSPSNPERAPRQAAASPQVGDARLRGCARRCGSEQVGGSCFPPQHRPGSEGLSSAALPSQFVKDLHRINSCLPRPV